MARNIEEDGRLGSHLACRDLPVMEIVESFRRMAGVRGRNSHRPFPVPKYEYEKGRTLEAKEAVAKALAGQQPTLEHSESPANVLLPQQEYLGGNQVDNHAIHGHHARWGEPGRVDLGPEAGQHLGVRRMGGDGDGP